MNKILKYTFILTTVCGMSLFISGCQRVIPAAGDLSHDVRIKALLYRLDASSTKAEAELGNDIIYAYPFALSNASMNGIVISPELINGNEYSYKMPESSQDIVFTNLIDGIGGYQCSIENPLMTVSMIDNSSGSDYDFVAGTLSKSSFDQQNPERIYPVHLKRKVAKVNILLRSKKKGSEELVSDLSAFFSRAEISVQTYATYQMTQVVKSETPDKADSCAESYSGEMTSRWISEVIPADDTLYLASSRYVFPSVDDANPVFTLTLTSHNGTVITLTSSMSQPILPNRQYNLTMTLRQKTSEFGFEIENFVDEEMNVDFDMDDLVPLTISSSMIVDQMSAQGTDLRNFEVGKDTIWCYSFSADSDTLLDGFPKAQERIFGSNYQYMIPKGRQRLVFFNHDMVNRNIGYKADKDYFATDAFTYSSMCIKMVDKEDDGKVDHSRPLIFGFPKENIIDVGKEGLQTSVSLTNVTTGLRILFKFDDQSIMSLSDGIESLWVNVSNLANFWQLSDKSYFNYNHYESERIFASEIPLMEHDGEACFEVTDYRYFLIRPNESNLFVRINLLLKDGSTKSIVFSESDNPIQKNGKNNIIIELKATDFNL